MSVSCGSCFTFVFKEPLRFNSKNVKPVEAIELISASKTQNYSPTCMLVIERYTDLSLFNSTDIGALNSSCVQLSQVMVEHLT